MAAVGLMGLADASGSPTSSSARAQPPCRRPSRLAAEATERNHLFFLCKTQRLLAERH
jgi:hypothetical protein